MAKMFEVETQIEFQSYLGKSLDTRDWFIIDHLRIYDFARLMSDGVKTIAVINEKAA